MISREWCGVHSDITVSARSASDSTEADTHAPRAPVSPAARLASGSLPMTGAGIVVPALAR
jgi:hypothetical protein